jgi:hypothetical protein
MPKGDKHLFLKTKKYGNILEKTKFHRYPKTSTTLNIQPWYHPHLLDKTSNCKRLDCATRKYQVPYIEFANIVYSPIKIDEVVPEPWQFKYERDEPYKVTFSLIVETYVEAKDHPQGILIDNYRDPPTYPVGILKKRDTKYQQPSLRYKGYWLGTTTRYLGNFYIRGQVRREKEKEAVKLRKQFFKFLQEDWVAQNQEKPGKAVKIEEDIKEEDFDYLGHLTEEELVELKKKVKIEEE